MTLGKTLIKASQKSKHLKSCPICSSLPEDALLSISSIATTRYFEKGELVMQEGEPCSGFFLVLSGKIRVFKSSLQGREKVLLVAEAGMTFGEDALFGPGVFLQSATAQAPTQVLHIPRKDFLQMLRENPELSFQVMESLCLWIRRLSSSVENVAFLTAKDKAASYLLGLVRAGNSRRVTLPGKKKDVADQLGFAPETLSRVLQEFEEQDIILRDKRTIEVLKLEELEEIAKQ